MLGSWKMFLRERDIKLEEIQISFSDFSPTLTSTDQPKASIYRALLRCDNMHEQKSLKLKQLITISTLI
ncbi:hypothetical protein KFK09_022146 [Dendrobium nobile]|uniref:Uncharacterized protein n=1 Tax=Dendrobium nobile TaxID=94219 RepID=A0A8T3AHU1_DENNO|nr:hypothetical protein KFK09_022146 [Dendrobium nobile]